MIVKHYIINFLYFIHTLLSIESKILDLQIVKGNTTETRIISWTTNTSLYSFVYYGLDKDDYEYDNVIEGTIKPNYNYNDSKNKTFTHESILTNLYPNTCYWYKIFSPPDYINNTFCTTD